ncbi:hypothetical protein ACWY4P_44320 [Streptomyces sp. LZ34]
MGRLDGEKNAYELLHTVAVLPQHALEHLADEFGSRDRVTLHGLATDQEVLYFCVRCDVF